MSTTANLLALAAIYLAGLLQWRRAHWLATGSIILGELVAMLTVVAYTAALTLLFALAGLEPIEVPAFTSEPPTVYVMPVI